MGNGPPEPLRFAILTAPHLVSLVLSDWMAVGLSAVGLGALVALGEGLRLFGVSGRSTRRVVHAGVGVFVAAAPWAFTTPGPLYALGGLFVLVNGAAKLRQVLPGMHAARPQSWGTVTFPLALLPAVAMTWSVSPERIPALQTAFLVLAVADPVAAWVGERRTAANSVEESGKTLAGSTAFAVCAALVTASALPALTPWTPGQIAIAAVVVATVGAAVEAIGTRGWDNLFVVLAVIVSLLAVESVSGGLVLSSVCAGAAFAGLSWRTRTLTLSGAIAGGLLAASLIGLGGWAWAVPGFAFFLLSSAISRLAPASNPEQEARLAERETDPSADRTLRQVLANGGVGWACLMAAFAIPTESGALVSSALYAAFLGAFAAAASDTWATEIGAWAPARPVSLRSFRRVPPGTSGAVSGLGTIAGVAGALCIAGLGTGAAARTGVLAGTDLGSFLALVALAGVAGMLADSLAGATIQARYRHPAHDDLVERPPRPESRPHRGWRFMTNSAVNVLATTTGAAIAALLVGT